MVKTELHDAAKNGDLEQVMDLVENKGFNVEEKDGCGWTPLHKAALFGHLEIVRYLVEQAHADIWIKDIFARTACEKAETEEIKEYLKKMMEDTEGGLTMTKSAAFNPFGNNGNDDDNDYNNGNDKLENESKNFNCSIMK